MNDETRSSSYRGEILILTWENTNNVVGEEWPWWHATLEVLEDTIKPAGSLQTVYSLSKLILLVRCVDAVSMFLHISHNKALGKQLLEVNASFLKISQFKHDLFGRYFPLDVRPNRNFTLDGTIAQFLYEG